MASRGWTCRRIRCGTLNEPQKKKCVGCGGLKPKKRVPAHKKALRDYTYDDYLSLNFKIHGVTEECACCGRERSQDRRLDRDHDHTSGHPWSGKPRGLVCPPCNKLMRDTQMNARAAYFIYRYLSRSQRHWADAA